MKSKRVLCIIVSALLACAALVGCKGKSPSGNTPPPDGNGSVPTLTLNRTSQNMIYGDVFTLIASYTEVSGQTLVWSSSDDGVATVADGMVKAVGVGNAVITATYGSLTATCAVNVTFGAYSPVLKLDHVSDLISLGNGESYGLNGSVLYNGLTFPCTLDVAIDDDSIVGYASGVLTGKKVGRTDVTVSTVWNGYDNPLLRKTFTVDVVSDVRLVTTVTTELGSAITNSVDLYSVSEFAGNHFINTATLDFTAVIGGVPKVGSLSYSYRQDKPAYDEIKDDIIALNGNVITAKNPGVATIECSVSDDNGTSYKTTFTVNVTCPVVRYDGELKFATDDAFPLENIFGTGAEYIAARQGEKLLTYGKTAKNFTDLVVRGKDTPAVEVLTTNGGYYFENVDAYNCILTASNIAQRLNVQTHGIITGYFYVGEDIGDATHPVDMGADDNDTTSKYFGATFDGLYNGTYHTIYAEVGKGGFFQALSNGAVVKNTHFVFTFKSSASIASGLACNHNFMNQAQAVTLDNVYVSTTNYTASTYALFQVKPKHLKMNNVLVVLNNNANLEFTDKEQTVAAMFQTDLSFTYGDFDILFNGYTNVYAVTGKFMPIGNGTAAWKGPISYHLNFAYNDIASTFGNVTREGASNASYTWCKITGVQKHGDWIRQVYSGSGGDSFENFIGAYYGNPSLANSGIARYNTTAQLRSAKVTQVGTWVVPVA